MKKENIITNLCMIAFIIVFFGSLLIAGYTDTHYSTMADVYEINNNSILLIDGASYIWEVTDRPDLTHKGQSVKIKFFNNTTDYTREDDEIIGVKVLP